MWNLGDTQEQSNVYIVCYYVKMTIHRTRIDCNYSLIHTTVKRKSLLSELLGYPNCFASPFPTYLDKRDFTIKM